MSDPINLINADFTFKDKNGNTGSNKGITDSDKTKLNNMVKLMNLILQTPNSADFINTLATKDFSNIDNMAKIAIAHNSVPSYICDELTIGASGTSYTPPTDGYVSLTMKATAIGQYCMINNGGFLFPTSSAPQAGTDMRLFVPVQKGTNFSISYNCPTTPSTLLFVYLNGTKHEKA